MGIVARGETIFLCCFIISSEEVKVISATPNEEKESEMQGRSGKKSVEWLYPFDNSFIFLWVNFHVGIVARGEAIFLCCFIIGSAKFKSI